MKKTIFLNNGGEQAIARVYGQGRKERLAEISELYPVVVTDANFKEHAEALRSAEAAFSTWGMLSLSAERLESMPALGAVFYAAGSVQGFARPLLERGIVVMSGWGANAIAVAEFTVAQILLANKGYFRNVRACSSAAARSSLFVGKGNFGETVAIIGAGMVGKAVIRLLKHFQLRVVVWDPFLTAQVARELEVEKVATMEEAFARGLVVSNHLANVPATRGLVHAALLGSLRPNATFINTGRGATVVEADLVQVFRERPDLTALLDVTDPEPPAADSPLYGLPNVHLTSHIAGSVNDEVVRMADYAIDDFLAWEASRPLRWGVTLKMLETMA